jgi:hypothetical protein
VSDNEFMPYSQFAFNVVLFAAWASQQFPFGLNSASATRQMADDASTYVVAANKADKQ